MRRQRRTITPDNSERLVTDVFYPVLFPERRIKCGLWPNFPGTFPINNDASAPADQEQNLFGRIVNMVGDHASDFSDVHPHRYILDSPEFGSQKEFGSPRRSSKLALYIRCLHKWHFAHKLASSLFHYAKSCSVIKQIPCYVKQFHILER